MSTYHTWIKFSADNQASSYQIHVGCNQSIRLYDRLLRQQEGAYEEYESRHLAELLECAPQVVRLTTTALVMEARRPHNFACDRCRTGKRKVSHFISCSSAVGVKKLQIEYTAPQNHSSRGGELECSLCSRYEGLECFHQHVFDM